MYVFFVLGSWLSVLDTAGRWLGLIGIMGWLIGGFTWPVVLKREDNIVFLYYFEFGYAIVRFLCSH